MGDMMLYGVLRMPFDMAMGGEIARRQFYSRVQEAASRLEAAEVRLAEIDEALASRPAEVENEEQSDAKRLMFAMQDIDGFVGVEQDKYDLAVVAMEERGLDEPDWECELEGVRRLIDTAMGTST